MSKNESGQDKAQLNTLVEQLKSKLKNFVVIDRQGELVGEVKDLMDTNHQLSLVLSQIATAPRSRMFLISSKLIQKTDAANKSLAVDINKAEIEQLPEYVIIEPLNTESETLVNSALEATDLGTENSCYANVS